MLQTLLIPAVAHAASFPNPLGEGTTLFSLIGKLIELLIQVGAVAVVLYFIYAGFLFVTANGDSGQIKTAKSALLYCVIGGLILLGAQAIQSAICATVREVGAKVSC